jgi:hypothetical protein
MDYATSRKVAGSSSNEVIEFFSIYLILPRELQIQHLLACPSVMMVNIYQTTRDPKTALST